MEGSPKEAAKGEKREDIAAAAVEFDLGGVAVADGPGEAGLEVGGMNKPGCNMANKLCCWAGVMVKGFIEAKAAKD